MLRSLRMVRVVAARSSGGGRHQRTELVGSVKRDVYDAVGFIGLGTHALDERERGIGEGSGGIGIHLGRRGTLGVVGLRGSFGGGVGRVGGREWDSIGAPGITP